MRDVVAEIERLRAAGEAVAVATVIQTWGSAPRREGARMVVGAKGAIAGSVSGGCVEGAVAEAAAQVLKTGAPKLLRFGVSDPDAWQVGLSCGGTIEVFVAALEATHHDHLRAALASEAPAAEVTVVRGGADILGCQLLLLGDGQAHGSLGADLDAEATPLARAALMEGRSSRAALTAANGTEVFIDVLRPPPALVVVGGVHIAVALTALAKGLGYHTTVIDPRTRFGSAERFPQVDRLIAAWPDEGLEAVGLNASTAVVVLTHDPKLDDPALRAALPSPAFYVGALGSKQTQAKRRQRLLDAGLTEAQIGRLHAPIGLDLGGRSPEEIALSVLAQIVAVRNRRAGEGR
jgi:xanthine dehydrogenase accessory factor